MYTRQIQPLTHDVYIVMQMKNVNYVKGYRTRKKISEDKISDVLFPVFHFGRLFISFLRNSDKISGH